MKPLTPIEKCERDQTCISCGGDAKIFRDKLSLTEYRISHFCQTCQDRVFNPSDDDPCEECPDKNNPDVCKECPI
jgi:uncharacterized CHY-type Zn-finger protein